jgi:hypothetical protein
MRRAIYAVGDTVTLKADRFRLSDSERVCRIVGILPSDHGEAQYRIRIGNETHERRVVASDIEAPETVMAGKTKGAPSTRGPDEPWFKPSSIRVKK